MPELTLTLTHLGGNEFIVEDLRTCAPIPLQPSARATARVNPTTWVRYAAAHGVYYSKAGSRFTDGETYLPLDLWDATDP
jgi:hypothetical protein